MPRICWPLLIDRPVIEVVLPLAQGGHKTVRRLLADTGAGARHAAFELVLDEHDCVLAGGKSTHAIELGGSYSGSYPLYVVRVEVPRLNFADDVFAVGIPTPPLGFDGIAGFRFLNRFTYGKFSNADEFGLEV